MGGSWLDNGHGDGESLSHVTGSSREVVGPPARDSGSWQSRSGKTVVAALAALALIGSAGTAYAIRETLFPTLGAPTSRSVWSNPIEPEEAAETTAATVASTTSTSTMPPTTAAQTSTTLAPVPETATTVEDHPVVVSAQGSGPGSRTGTSGRTSGSNTVATTIDDSEEHASTTVSNTGPSVPEETGGAATTDGSGSGSSGSGSGNSGSGHSGGDDDEPDVDEDQPKVDDQSQPDD